MLPGEGVGLEVTAAALHVLDAVERRFGIALRQEPIQGGALYYKEHGLTLEPDGMRRAGAADAMLVGAMGWPEIRFPDGTEITPQIDIRGEYNLFAGVRPIRAIPGVPVALADPRAAGIDLVILRESTEGMFARRSEGVITADYATDTMVITRSVTERLTRFACDLALRRKASRGTPGRVTLVDKANVFRSFAFMREVFLEMAAQSPEVEARGALRGRDGARPGAATVGVRRAADGKPVRRHPVRSRGRVDRWHGFRAIGRYRRCAWACSNRATAPRPTSRGRAWPTRRRRSCRRR